VTHLWHLFSAVKTDKDEDNGTVECPNSDDELGNPASNGLDGKKLLKSGDKPK